MKYRKAGFRSACYVDRVIVDEQDGVVGTHRLKPSGVGWKPKGGRKYYSVRLQTFIEWIIKHGEQKGH